VKIREGMSRDDLQRLVDGRGLQVVNTAAQPGTDTVVWDGRDGGPGPLGVASISFALRRPR